MTIGELWNRVMAWSRRDELGRELSDEMHEHLHLLTRDFEQEGMSHADALAAARRRIGNVGQRREQAREVWGFPAIERVVQDIRYALRGLRRSPGFTATVVVTLALGIGANAAMFGVIDRLMFRPFPYMRTPSEVNRVYLQATYRGRVRTGTTMPYTRYRDLERASSRIGAFAGITEWRLAVGTGDASRVRKVAGVTASYWDFFTARPALGRFFRAAEDSIPEGEHVAVLSHGFWVAEFGGRDVTGQPLQVGTLAYTIIGVLPPGFIGTVGGKAPDVYVPITTVPRNINEESRATYFIDYRWDWTDVFVRRRPGVTPAAASASLSEAFVLSRNLARALNPAVLPDSLAHARAIAGPAKDAAGPDAGLESQTLLWVTGVAVIVLLIACANVANLLFARVLRRRREIAVRLALGVSRRRLVAQFLTEGALLAALGCAGGVAVAQWAGAAIQQLLLPQASSFDLTTDWRTLGIAGGCALLAAVLTALGPALLATRSDLAATLKAGAREGTYHRSRLRSALLVTQAALSVVLLVGAGLFVRSLDNARSIRLGYDAEPVLQVIPDFRGLKMDSSAKAAIRRRLLSAAQAIPGVEFAARVNSDLFRTSTADLSVPGIDSIAALGRFNTQVVTPDYFKVMQTRIIRGRSLAETDREGTPPVVVVSEAMGRVLWPGQDAIGQCIRVGFGLTGIADRMPCTTVVGIAEDAAQQSLTDEERFMYYLPVEQVAPAWVSTLLLRMSGPRAALQMERVRAAMQREMPGQGFVVVRPLQEVVDDQRRSWRLGATMFVAFGALALVVAAVGLYGVIGYNVAQRMHELGVRVALGAQSRDVVRLIVGQGMAFAFAGVAIGLGLAFMAARWIQPLLFKESARDPATYIGVGVLIALVGLLASAIPALRAARADPNVALRSD